MSSNASSIFNKLPAQFTDAELLRLRCDSQSLTYYGDISQFLTEHIKGFHTVSLLDIGPRTGSGLALLRLMHHPASFSRLKLDPVQGIDLDPAFEFTAFREFRDIGAQTGNIFDLPEKSWDIVTCSHTIEHVVEVDAFLAQITKIARQYVLIACPFAEKELISGHVTSIDYEILSRNGFDIIRVYESHHWHNGLCCLAIKSAQSV